MRPPEDVKADFVRQWLRKADADLETARHLVQARPDLCFSAAFHAQQAAEKVIKAALVWRQVEFPKTHDLDRLIGLLAAVDERLGTHLHDGRKLTPYGVDARYPGDLPEPSAAEAKAAVDIAIRIRTDVLETLPREFRRTK